MTLAAQKGTGYLTMKNYSVLSNILFVGIFTILIVLSQCILRAGAHCDHVGEDALLCTGLPRLEERNLNYSNIEQNVCWDNRTDEILNCTEFAVDKYDCRFSLEQRLLVDTDKYFQLMDYFCTHFKTYVENSDCISKHGESAWGCIEETFEIPDTTESIHELLCGLYMQYQECYTKIVELQCGRKAADFVYDFISLSYGSCFPIRHNRLKYTTSRAETTGLENILTSIQGSTVDPSNKSCCCQPSVSLILLTAVKLTF